jgi:hypothetical protein
MASSFAWSSSISAWTSRRTLARTSRASGDIFLFAILVVLSEKLVELLLDPHQRQDDSPEIIGAQPVVRHETMVATSRLRRKTQLRPCLYGAFTARLSAVAVAPPACAVTIASSMWPVSVDDEVYDAEVAPAICEHTWPFALQRCHW